MKTKILFASAVSALVLVGCAKTGITMLPPQSENGENPIVFSTYVPQTPDVKGLETDGESIKKAGIGFGVNVAYTGQAAFDPTSTSENIPDFMYNQHVEFKTAWTYTPLKYWPTQTNDKLSFFAWAPYGGAGIKPMEKNERADQLRFSIDTDNPESTVDFVAASIVNKTKPTDLTQPLEFSLAHELTRVDILAAADENLDSNTKLVITDVRLLDTADDKIYKSALYTFGNNTFGEWTVADTDCITADYSLKPMVNMSPMSEMGGYEETGYAITGTDYKGIFDANHKLYLIPVNGTSGIGSDTDATIQFTYDIVTIDGELADGHIVTTAVKVVKLPTGTLAQGKSYIFKFKFTMDGIALSAKVLGWGEDHSEEITIPQS